jgi:hypothetical protein
VKIIDTAGTWTVEGMHVATFPADEEVDDRALLAYYGIGPQDRKYAQFKQAIRFDRFVVMRNNGSFIIIPMNPSLFLVLET